MVAVKKRSAYTSATICSRQKCPRNFLHVLFLIGLGMMIFQLSYSNGNSFSVPSIGVTNDPMIGSLSFDVLPSTNAESQKVATTGTDDILDESTKPSDGNTSMTDGSLSISNDNNTSATTQDQGGTMKSIPSPLPFPDATLMIEPTYGQHRPHIEEVIFSFARGYQVPDFFIFLDTLFKTGYEGDLVLGVSWKNDKEGDELREYLEYQAHHHAVIVYDIPLACIEVKIRKHCQVINMFALLDLDGKQQQPLQDTRGHREVAQLRFEYYWAWSTFYQENSTIFLLDCRDVFFQRHPFRFLDDNSDNNKNSSNTAASTMTSLAVWEETNLEPIWKQRSNRRWILKAHADSWLDLKFKTVICSGSTMGGQPAIVAYTSAMVAQFDETNCTLYGCDQGHHNYLIHTDALQNVENISSIEIYKQGQGLVNTIGLFVSVHNQTMRAMGLVDNATDEVLNNDGRTVPAIIHQFDRDEDLAKFMGRKRLDLMRGWKGQRASWRRQKRQREEAAQKT